MLSWERLLLVDDSNNSFVLRWINNSPTLSSVFISAVQTKDQLIKSVKESQTYNSLQANMLFTWSSVSFIFFSIIFVGASAVSSVFILPLLFLSFIFSGLVVIFSGLSYTTFKLASSKYNHTVLFLNKLLRKLADNIPPAVGFEEIQQAKQSPWEDLGLPSLRLSERFNKLYGLITYPFTKKPALETHSTPIEKQDFQVEQADPAVPIIYDDEEPNLENGIEEPLVEPTPIVDQEENPSPTDDQPIKDSEVDNNED